MDSLEAIPIIGRHVPRPRLPERIVCLTEETAETLYALGAGDLVVGCPGIPTKGERCTGA
ncbi:hypothetical protein [Synechococcus sp. W65.1]|uniref:hypothetical protein n=1 Tax=unclassified Synechococcus TaxID=2626047 RepID=UPI0039C2C1DF